MAESKYKTGLCSIKACEGTAPKNVFGQPLPTCKNQGGICACKCHKDLDELFRIAEMPRIPVDKSGYVPDKGDFIMPTPTEIAAERTQHDIATPVIRTESPDPSLVPHTVTRTFAPTPTGRSGRGELEQQVDAVCKVWLIDNPGVLCTPKYISVQIENDFGIRQPSVGAIGAVFDRWTELGYADCQRKPVRFVKFTDDGLKLGLEGCKERARRKKAR